MVLPLEDDKRHERNVVDFSAKSNAYGVGLLRFPASGQSCYGFGGQSVRQATPLAAPIGAITQREEAMAAFSHVAVGTNDLAKARAFYDSVLAPLGLKRLKDLGAQGFVLGRFDRGIPGTDPGRRETGVPGHVRYGQLRGAEPGRRWPRSTSGACRRRKGRGRGRTARLLAQRLCRLRPRPRRPTSLPPTAARRSSANLAALGFRPMPARPRRR